MKKTSTIFLFLLGLLSLSPFLSAADLTSEDRGAIEKRATELISILPEKPDFLVPPISDRPAWDAFGANPKNAGLIPKAERLLPTPMEEAPEELYKEFYQNGNRNHYQKVNQARIQRVFAFALAEMIENKGRFLPPLEEALRNLCAYPSWSLPAHDGGGEIYDGKRMAADLCATNVGGNLAILHQAMKGVLSPETAALVADNVRRRVLAPYEESVRNGILPGMSWIVTTNNWNTVCHCGTVAAALALCESPEERAWFLASAEHCVTKNFFLGFTPDGYCSEGISYWNYGYGHFAQLAEITLRATKGEINLFACPKVPAASRFALNMEVAPDRYAAFADCSITARPDKMILALLSRRVGLGLTKIERENGNESAGSGDFVRATVFGFPLPDFPAAFPTSDSSSDPASSVAISTDSADGSPINRPRTEFPDAGILICRTPSEDTAQVAAVFKGGHNNELHNHNDVGTFGILFDGVWLVQDPGGETYTARTFSKRRYEGELLNSFGHPVPRINGNLQATGDKAHAVVLEKTFSDTQDVFILDLTSAYPDSGAVSVIRRFDYFRSPVGEPNRVLITDRIEFVAGQPGTAEIPLITFHDWSQEENADENVILIKNRPNEKEKSPKNVGLRVRFTAVDGDENLITSAIEAKMVGENDDQVRNKPTRIAFTLTEKKSIVTVVTEITPIRF